MKTTDEDCTTTQKSTAHTPDRRKREQHPSVLGNKDGPAIKDTAYHIYDTNCDGDVATSLCADRGWLHWSSFGPLLTSEPPCIYPHVRTYHMVHRISTYMRRQRDGQPEVDAGTTYRCWTKTTLQIGCELQPSRRHIRHGRLSASPVLTGDSSWIEMDRSAEAEMRRA